MKTLASMYHIEHLLTVGYSPWSNGTVEPVNGNIRASTGTMQA